MNNIIKPESRELDFNRVSKTTIFKCLMRIKIDHSINISENDLDAKINLLHEDCKEISNSQFFARSEELRKSNLFGKFPRNEDFFIGSISIKAFKLNSIAGDNYFKSVQLGDEVKITCNPTMKTKAYNLPVEIKKEIKAQFKQPINIV